MTPTHSTLRSEARGVPVGLSDPTELAEVSGRRLRVDPERGHSTKLMALSLSKGFLPRFRGLAPSNVSIVFVLSILMAGLLSLSLHDAGHFLFFSHALAAPNLSSPPLIASEQEVREFFTQYAERYNEMDVDRFLRLFSLKAKQNQRDGLSEIRIIYSDYFKQMLSLRNSIEEMKIEIYQNGAEVKARYAVDQVLKKGEKKVLKGTGRWVLIKEDGMLKILSFDYKHEKTL